MTIQAIETSILPATNTKPTRIKAMCLRGQLTLPSDLPSNTDEHRRVVFALLQKFLKEDNALQNSTVWSWPFFTGGLPNGNLCHVLVDPKFTKFTNAN